MDEMELRAVVLALRSHLPDLVGPAEVERLGADLTAALLQPAGRAAEPLQQVLLDTPTAVQDWLADRLRHADTHRLRRSGSGPGATGVDGHQPVVWLEERDEHDLDPLEVGETYVLVATAAVEGANARYVDALSAPDGEGVATTWVLSSTTVRIELHPDDPQVEVVVAEVGDEQQWQAVFPLFIPVQGDSVRRRMRITPLAAAGAVLDSVVTIGDGEYRRIHTSFDVRARDAAEGPDLESLKPGFAEPVSSVLVGTVSAGHVGLTPAAGWQRPRRVLEIDVMGAHAQLVIRERGVRTRVAWGSEGDIKARSANVRAALRAVREAHPKYFERIDPNQLAVDLRHATAGDDWSAAAEAVPDDAEAWATVLTSDQLYDLAFEGYALFQAVFADERLRDHVASLDPGDQIELNWLTEFAPGAPHVPLPLLYCAPVNPGVPIDPLQFLGLRHRLAYNRRESRHSRALGEWQKVTRAHTLYWGDGHGDVVGAEAARHLVELRQWAPFLAVPRGEPRITQLERFLSAPEPQPLALLYFYCHCEDETGDGQRPMLRFGSIPTKENILRRSRMGTDHLAGEPVVFVNACSSAASDPSLVNQLMEAFLDRGARGYIGTEEEIPPGVAARFATTFFSFLYGTKTRPRAPVGEAVSQARRFLFQRYRNLGGLFYNHVNDYLLYAADDATISEMRTV